MINAAGPRQAASHARRSAPSCRMRGFLRGEGDGRFASDGLALSTRPLGQGWEKDGREDIVANS
jgi:hypothetical protein